MTGASDRGHLTWISTALQILDGILHKEKISASGQCMRACAGADDVEMLDRGTGAVD